MTTISKPTSGTLLAVDTSTSAMSVALTRGAELLGELNSNAERNHSIHLIPSIQQVLGAEGLHPRDLDAFAVGVGPGSYTGVRIGVTVAKTFAWTHGMTLLGVSSLEALALGGGEAYLAGAELAPEEAAAAGPRPALTALTGQPETLWLVPMFEARRGQAFTALYQASPLGWSCLAADGIRLMSAWTDELLNRALNAGAAGGAVPDRILFIGDTELHMTVIGQFGERWPGRSGTVRHEMHARHIAELGRRQWQAGDTRDIHGLVPNYTQLTEAEVNLLAKKS